MPFWCIDPTDGDDASGAVQSTQAAAELTPYKTLAAIEAEASPPAAGDSILFQGSDLALGIHALDVGTDGTAGNPITFGSYGTGKGGIDANGGISAIDTNSNEYLTFDGLELTGGLTDVSNGKVMSISGGNTVAKYITVKNCHLHDPEPSEVDGEGHGLRINAANTTVLDTEINSTSDDGIYCEADDVEIGYMYIHDVDRSISSKSGDCAKFSSAGTCKNGRIHHCILDHSARNRKSAAIVQGTDTGQVLEHNKCMGAASTVFFGADAGICRRNLLIPHKKGLYGDSTVVITRADAIVIQDAPNATFESNIIDSQQLFTPTNHLHVADSVSVSNNLTIQGNVIYGPLETGGQSVRISGTGTGHIIRNNIIGGQRMNGATGTFHINAADSVTFSECDYNIYIGDGGFKYDGNIYTTFTTWQTAAAGFGTPFDQNSIALTQAQAETLFRDPANGDFRINTGQEVAGVQLNYKDFLGRVNFPTIIGAYIQQTMLSSTGNSVDTAVGTVDTTIGTVLSGAKVGGSSVYGDAVKYPEWGIRS